MNAKIIANTPWGDKYGILKLEAPEFAAAYKPGQMCMLSVTAADQLSTDPLMRRTFAPMSASAEAVTLIYAKVGRGTNLLSQQPAGAVLSLSMPKGKPFTLAKSQRVALVAGGVGMAPMYALANALVANGCDVHIYYGGRTAADIFKDFQAEPAPFRWYLATEDGSIGAKGFSTTAFQRDIASFDMCYTCGPKPMMAAVQKLCAEANKPLQVSMEQVMACGIGVCLGCLIDLKSGKKRCCTEGPVFDGHEIVW